MFKKFFGIIFAVGLASMVTGIFTHTWADTTSSIFKVQAYSYNSVSQMYEVQQYGSAVLVAKDTLLTNAHVVTDDNNNFTLQYEACQTISDSDTPKCFSTLKLLRYDKTTDLALLQIVNPTDDMPSPVMIGSGTLPVGTAISVIGYPANGGDSITTTQGTIAGYEGGYYKTDANLDGGNSGGGGFDAQGNFIGVPTFVVNGQTTLGYLIPIATIQQFLDGDIGTTSSQSIAPAFTSQLLAQYGLATQENISNNLFTVPNFSGYGLSLNSSIEKINNNLYEYTLENKNTTQVQLYSLIATDDAAIQKYVNALVRSSKASGMMAQKTTKKIGTSTRQIVITTSDDIMWYEYIQTHSTNKTYMDFIIAVDKDDIQSDFISMQNFVEAIMLHNSYTKPQVLNLPGISLSSKRGVGIIKWIDTNGLNISVLPTSTNFSIDLSAYPAAQGMTVKKILTSVGGSLDGVGTDYTVETSKYPTKVGFITTTDDNNQVSISAFGIVQSGITTAFVRCDISLRSAANKQEAMTMVYKIFGLE